MRSRYSAFALANGAYLRQTSTMPMGDGVEAWAQSVVWLGLSVVRAEGATVEFIAHALEGPAIRVMHEVSRFEQHDGRWLYVAGEPDVTAEKVERNAPCPCGSGKKFKHCHAP
jgi:SEC-C motif-containing protein